ncbi:MAG: hypothetical protein MJ188_04695 [Treponema sp.]|nr:hypothetical protein [Treponema sp.]
MKNIKCIFLLIFCLMLTGCFTDSWSFGINDTIIFRAAFEEEDIYFEGDDKIVLTYSGNCLDIDYVYIKVENNNYVKKLTHKIDYNHRKIIFTDFDINRLKNSPKDRIMLQVHEKDYCGYYQISCEINEETGDIDFYDFKKKDD